MLSDSTTELLACGILATLAVGLVVWIVAVFLRSPYTASQFPLYMLSLFMSRVLWRAEIRGRWPIRSPNGAVIVSNHRGPIDPAFIGLACDRPVHWLVAKEYFSYPVFGRALRALQTIPVNRGGVDTAATKLALRYARAGDYVGLFPEGRINETDRLLLPGRPGAALVALKTRVPVIPCYIAGSPYDGSIWRFLITPAKCRLVVGEPIDLSPFYGREGDKEVFAEVTKLFMREIAKLAGVADYQPELAGRQWKTGGVDLTDSSLSSSRTA